MATKAPRSWAPYALIAIVIGVLILLAKLIISIIWALFVVVLVVICAAGLGLLIAGRLSKR
ncbi:hypothetical protein Back2_17380 [Nocardioides baekrokdamisoli]|uniref:Uncharacterized protein n=1 Tax=Nocardioides baekrokdamisoli TaxID=1804624 RepID=A0A3G9IUW5_9ACTN|nr:hypothetical protein [Nocardioides baekrokdamisoli]BBH17451.1 hypothetical protein Back2_17380 [Nocardioides baekrokdamisoli]